MDKIQDPAAAETARIADVLAVDLPHLVRLLPCPFCGSEARIGQGNGWPGEKVIECSNDEHCRAQMSCVWGHYSERELWNTRVDSLEVARWKKNLIQFAIIYAAQYGKDHYAGGCLHSTHYDLLAEAGARMDDFKRCGDESLPNAEPIHGEKDA